ncbi:hypothetical protein CEE37_05515 [candidate division LCP-89 bacterium B3_LCP]|uniref:Ubiquinone biosynthesis protein UbiA n=1 Tax=candidate division LCP-89 bacterium B3_LCP TaxID=2012998 RepID=A0A532V2A6_UNCL8|nr:MAG: hypothetical protein CEE37_05515 [candidate division LCP-89 bacterium B3_LCP]
MVKPGWFDTFFILRPTLFFPAWTFFLAGYSRGNGSNPALLMLWLAAGMGASFLLNQLSDRQEDRLNSKLWALWGKYLSTRTIYAELVLLIAAAVVGGIWAGLELSLLLTAYFLIGGYFYNFPPFRLKARPISGIIACGIGVWLFFLIGMRAGEGALLPGLVYGLPYALAGAAVTLLTHVPDIKGDRQAGVRTFPAVYGLTKTGAWACGLVGLCAILTYFLRDYILLAASLISLPFFIRYYLLKSSETAQFAVKISIFCIAIGVGLTWIPFLVIIALYYPFARWYHRERLGLNYPGFDSKVTPEESVIVQKRQMEEIETI